MSVALVLGSGHTLADDVARYTGPYHGVVACNDAGAWWPYALDAWVTLHPEKFEKWIECRAGDTGLLVSHRQPKPHIARKMDVVTTFMLPGVEKTGSSGMFAAKVALVDLKFDHAVLCGIPMTATPHFHGATNWLEYAPDESHAYNFRRQWIDIDDDTKGRMRSMSGWTKTLLGSPEWNDEAGYARLMAREKADDTPRKTDQPNG